MIAFGSFTTAVQTARCWWVLSRGGWPEAELSYAVERQITVILVGPILFLLLLKVQGRATKGKLITSELYYLSFVYLTVNTGLAYLACGGFISNSHPEWEHRRLPYWWGVLAGVITVALGLAMTRKKVRQLEL